MSLNYVITDLPAVWPGRRTVHRKRAPFKTQWARTLSLLERELLHLGARKIEFALGVRPNGYDVRADGQLRADARPEPPVIISFLDREGQRQAYPCDTFGWWQDNVYAIAIVLEDLRRAERYGVQSALLRAGFKTLPAAGASTPTLSSGQAAALVARLSGTDRVDEVTGAILTAANLATGYLRAAKNRTHPDNGGRTEEWAMLQDAERVIKAHHGIRP